MFDPASRDRDLFEELVELPRDARLTRARELCGDDSGLYRRVEALLLAHERAHDLTGEVSRAVGALPAHEVGATIGPYRIVDRLGEGGMGIVYLAEQSAPIRREVALKVVRIGMESEAVVARFEAERQTLARMEHPGIARVFDAGATPEGRPYFVMEYVRGRPITRHADEERLTPRERLALFAELCRAVEHAHQKGVIHRDLKPNNVLVAEGAESLPKVIDFGIAKATEEAAGGQLLTVEAQVLGTPAYMSPEQARGALGEVDTRSDVYSLGVLLYELMTGSPPIELPPDQGVVAALKHVEEVDPERPSTRAGTTTDAAHRAAEMRRTRPRELQRFLRGDLDRIVLKAMDKERDRRYDSASALGEDVRRFLASEPIEARAPTVSYLTRRFVRRHRGLAAGIALAAVAIVAGTVASVLWALRAERAAELANDAETVARSEATTSNEVLGFVEQLFGAAAPSVADGEEMTVRQVVDTAQGGLIERFPEGSWARARVESMLGRVLVNLGDYADAADQLEGALPALASREDADPGQLLSTQVSLGDAFRHLDRFADARRLYESALESAGSAPSDPEMEGLRANSELGLGFMDRDSEQVASAEQHFRAAIEHAEAAEDQPILLAEAWMALASCFTLTGRFDESLDAMETAREIAGPDAPGLFLARLESTIGNLEAGRGRLEEARAAFERAIEVRESVVDPDHPTLVLAYSNLVGMRGATGDIEGAEANLRRAVEIHRVSPGDPYAYAKALQNLGNCRYMGEDLPAAVELWEEALEIWVELAGPKSRAATSLYGSLSEGHLALGDEERANEMADLARQAEASRSSEGR